MLLYEHSLGIEAMSDPVEGGQDGLGKMSNLQGCRDSHVT